jgi:hypothetical protein
LRRRPNNGYSLKIVRPNHPNQSDHHHLIFAARRDYAANLPVDAIPDYSCPPTFDPAGTVRIILIIAIYCFIAAIAVMPIADALAIVFIEPFILLIMAKWLFNEQVGRRRITAIGIGFIGVILVIQPSFNFLVWRR